MIDYARAFGFLEWPFRVVVDEEFSRVWADRALLRREIDRRLSLLPGLPHSTVQLMWADVGAGKSHTLRHIEGRCNRASPRELVPVYTEFTLDLDGLLGLFGRFVEALPDSLLSEAGSRLVASSRRPAKSAGGRDLWQALKLLSSNDASGQSLAHDWLLALPGVPNLRLLKSYGLSARIDNETRVVEILAELVRLIRELRLAAAVVWLIDEYQLTASLKPRRCEALSQALIALFNSCGPGLHVIMSFSVAQQSVVSELIPPALKSRASTFQMLALPYLDHQDAASFVPELFAAFRSSSSADKFFPLTEGALGAVLDEAESSKRGGMTPRSLMETLSQVLLSLYEAADGRPHLPIPEADCRAALAKLASDA